MTFHKSIDASDAKSQLNQDAVLVDVREPAEFNNKHIKGAKLHPLGTIDAATVSQYSDKTVYVYCQKGMRGQKACEKILQANPNANLVNITGGIEACELAGFDINKGTSSVIPLDRQVQMTIGGSVLLFCLLSVFVTSNFVWGAAFFGAGLLFAGISGFCGLARVMALAPWNK